MRLRGVVFGLVGAAPRAARRPRWPVPGGGAGHPAGSMTDPSKGRMRAIAVLLVVTMASTPVLASAQGTPATTPAKPSTPSAKVESTPLSLARVRRQLIATEVGTATRGDVLRIEEFVNVYGKSIAFDIMKDYDVTARAVQYGGMTHGEFLHLVTPEVYRNTGVDVFGLALGAAKWAMTRNAEKRKKAEQERIEDEARRLRALGVPPPQ